MFFPSMKAVSKVNNNSTENNKDNLKAISDFNTQAK